MTDHPGPGPGPVAIGLDLGTSSLKGVAVLSDGSVVARASAAYPTARPGPGAAEQRPADWLAAARAVIGALAAEVPQARWSCIGLSGMLPTLVAAAADGTAIGAAITWEDGRAEEHGLRLREAVGADALYATTGQWVDGRYLLPAMARLRTTGDARGVAPRVLGAKDWLFERLTLTPATDPSTAAGFGCFSLATGTWDRAIVHAAFWDVPGGHPDNGADRTSAAMPDLPPVRPSTHTAPVTAVAGALLGLPVGLPVVLGAADSVLAARGLGVTEPGRVAYVAGTSTVILGIAPSLVVDPAHRFLVTPLERPGPVGLEMDLVATGSAVGWLAELLGLPAGDEAEIWRMAGEVAPGADGLILLPYLGHGEQGALWDPTLRGTLVGATLSHGRTHLARALLDGIVLESRRCLEVLHETTGVAGDIVVAGASAHSPAFTRTLADATGRRVRWVDDPGHPASAWGAATLALEALGLPVPASPRLAEGIAPDPGAAGPWRALWHRHELARLALPAPRAAVPRTAGATNAGS